MNDPIREPYHYTVYPIQPIEITRHLGFCLGNATKYVLRAPYKGGVEDCLKAERYLDLQKEQPCPTLLGAAAALQPAYELHEFLSHAEGDDLWLDIARAQKSYLWSLMRYLQQRYEMNPKIWENIHWNMTLNVQDLRRVLSLRDTTGQIYDGMTGLPQMAVFVEECER